MMGIFLTYMKQEPEIQGTWIEGQTKVLMKQKIYQSFVFPLQFKKNPLQEFRVFLACNHL